MAQTNDTGIDYAELDPGVRRTVAWLRSKGFDTTDSGDGRSKLSSVEAEKADENASTFDPEECGVLDFPHVAIKSSATRLVHDASRLAIELVRVGVKLAPFATDEKAVSIQATYDPCDGSAVLFLSGLDDDKLVDAITKPARK